MSPEILIIGGGAAGLSAAAALAQGGRSVVIVDRSEAPMGQASGWCCLATDRCQRCGLCLLHDVQSRVQQMPLVRRLAADVTAIEGTQGNFRATLKATVDGADVPATLEADAVVLATGFVPFDPRGGRPMGYGELNPVVTTVDVNRALRDDDLSALRFAGGATKSLAFLQCIGSRDPEAGRGYCSQVCCQGSLRAARALLHRHPDWQITVFYIDLQVYGKTARSRFAELAPKLRFVQGVPAEILPDEDGAVRLAFQDSDGTMTQESFDGVVLAVGMVPSPGADVLAESLGVSRTIGGFLDADSAPDGVQVAGTCAGPSFIEASLLAGRQAAGLLLRGGANHCARRAVVIGRGDEGNVAAEALAAAGVPVTLVQLDRATPTTRYGIETVRAGGVASLRGQLGGFSLQLADAGAQDHVEADALVLAPGLTLAADPDPELKSLPHQSLADFVDSLEGDATSRRVALLLDRAGPAWRPAAAAALDAATRAVAQKQSEVTVVFRHIALPGLHGQRRYDDARRAGVRFLRQGDALPRAASGDEPALILTDAAAPETAARLPIDTLVVTEHPDADGGLSRLAQRCGVGLDREGLAQRGSVRLFPMHTERPGIWVLGNARQEAGAKTVREEAASVAAEVHALLTDDARFSREAPAQIDNGHCVHCLTCVRVCPHGAVTARPESTPLVSATACEQCGACVAACPGEAITLTPEAIPAPGVDSGGTVIFACRSSGAPALGAVELPPDVTVVEMACGGAVSELDMLRAFLAGARRVLLLSCHAESCAHVDNHLHCAERARLLAATAERIGLPGGAFEHWTVAPTEGSRVTHRLAAEPQKEGAQ
jgi:heterodisulfide reductase subunit A